jgi:hypothetical protein
VPPPRRSAIERRVFRKRSQSSTRGSNARRTRNARLLLAARGIRNASAGQCGGGTMTDVLRGRLTTLYAAMKSETFRRSDSSILIRVLTR